MGSDTTQIRDAAPGYGVEAQVQDVPPGYKRTEVGVIPRDWEIRRLGDHVKFLRHGVNSRAELSSAGSVRYLHYGDIHTSTDVRLNPRSSSMPYLPTDRAGALDRLQNGDLVLVDASEDLDGVGRSVEITGISDEEVVSGLHTIAARFDKSILADGFKAYLQFCPQFRDHLKRLAAGTKVYATNRSHIATVEMPLPGVTEQRAIAEALSDVDGLMGALEALIAKKRAIKQAAMQQLLTGKTRLPGFSGAWTELNMAADSILKARIGWQGLTTAEYKSSGEYYLVTGTDFVNGRVDWTTCHFVNRERFMQDRNIQLIPGDVLLTKDGTIGKAGYVDALPGPATLNSGVFVIRPKNDAYIPLYMYYVLNSRIFDDFLARLQAGSTITHLYQKDFVGFAFDAPSRDEQTAIATVLSDMDTEIAALEARRDKTRALKQGMMQQLLTGRVRLVEPETTS